MARLTGQRARVSEAHSGTQDDLPTSSISRLRAQGLVTVRTTLFRLSIMGVTGVVPVVHRDFPNGGGWSFFACPQCDRRVRVLKLYDGRFGCRRCIPLPFRCQRLSPIERAAQRIQRLEALLSRGPVRKLGAEERLMVKRGMVETLLWRLYPITSRP
jgi:hypothetical protein